MRQEIFLKKIELEGCPYGAAEKYRLERWAETAPECVPGSKMVQQREKAAVWLTDDGGCLQELSARGACVIYLLTQENRDDFCAGAEWCMELPEEEQLPGEALPDWISMEFLWRIWLRKQNLPWQIAETDRLYLREMTEDDLDFLYECQEDAQTARFVAGPKGEREEELEKIRAYRRLIYGFYGFGLWIVCEKESGKPVGRAGLQIREAYEIPELGFEIAAGQRQKGYAREALEAVLSYAKEELELEEVRSVVNAENFVSRKLCESLGFIQQERKTEDGVNWIYYSRAL